MLSALHDQILHIFLTSSYRKCLKPVSQTASYASGVIFLHVFFPTHLLSFFFFSDPFFAGHSYAGLWLCNWAWSLFMAILLFLTNLNFVLWLMSLTPLLDLEYWTCFLLFSSFSIILSTVNHHSLVPTSYLPPASLQKAWNLAKYRT